MDCCVDIISVDKIHEPNKIHNGKPITRLEVSPNGKYLVTYSEDDNSIVGWDVDKIFEGQLKPDNNTIEINDNYKPNQICVSDDKKLVCICIYGEDNFLSK
jgi:WD40 repeat protein